jgi:hypothetical protein
MKPASETHLQVISPHEANRLHKLALQRAQVLRREAIADAWQFVDSAFQAALGLLCRGAKRVESRFTAKHKTQETTTTLKESDSCPHCN